MVSCDGCGADLSDTAKFCESCGAPVAGPGSGPGRARPLLARMKKLVKWAVITLFVLFLALLLLGFVLNAMHPPNCGDAYCKPPNICCRNVCYTPCGTGYFTGDDCRCHLNGSVRCGTRYCSPDTDCCQGQCYEKLTSGSVRTSDCTSVPVGSELCKGRYYKPCPTGYFRATDCACTPLGAWECGGITYKKCGEGTYPDCLTCTCSKTMSQFTCNVKQAPYEPITGGEFFPPVEYAVTPDLDFLRSL